MERERKDSELVPDCPMDMQWFRRDKYLRRACFHWSFENKDVFGHHPWCVNPAFFILEGIYMIYVSVGSHILLHTLLLTFILVRYRASWLFTIVCPMLANSGASLGSLASASFLHVWILTISFLWLHVRSSIVHQQMLYWLSHPSLWCLLFL